MTDNQAPSLPPVEALRQLVKDWRAFASNVRQEAKNQTSVEYATIAETHAGRAECCADELEKALMARVASPQTWQAGMAQPNSLYFPERLRRWINRQWNRPSTTERQKETLNGLVQWLKKLEAKHAVASLRGGPANK